MRILYVFRKPRVNGNFSIESYFNYIASELELKHDIIKWYAPLESNGVFNRIFSIICLRLHCLINEYDIIHITGDIHFLIWGVPKKKSVLTIHDIGFLNRKKGIKRKILKYFWLCGPIKRAKFTTCVSQFTKQEIINEISIKLQQSISVIPTLISPVFCRTEKLFNQTKPIVLFIGTAPNKNLDGAIDALMGLRIKLDIVGAITWEQRERLKDVEFCQWDKVSEQQLIQLYHECDVLLMCSFYEGFGMPILEAQSVGRIVVTSNCSSMPEVAGKGAIFVNPKEINSIKNGLKIAISNQRIRERTIERGFVNSGRYKIDEVLNQYLNLYNNVKKN